MTLESIDQEPHSAIANVASQRKAAIEALKAIGVSETFIKITSTKMLEFQETAKAFRTNKSDSNALFPTTDSQEYSAVAYLRFDIPLSGKGSDELALLPYDVCKSLKKHTVFESAKIYFLYIGQLEQKQIDLAAIGYTGLWCVRRGKKLKILPAELLLKQDKRAPVLYLRSFAVDGSEISTNNIGPSPLAMFGIHLEAPTDEEDLATVFGDIGPFVAIGRPQERLPELGASRMYVSNDDWQGIVTDLIRRANLVVLRAGTSDGFLWELENVVKNCDPKRAILYLPFQHAAANRKPAKTARPDPYEEFRKRANERLPQVLPEEIGASRFIVFSKDWVPECVQGLTGFQQSFGQSLTGSRANNTRRELARVFQSIGFDSEHLRPRNSFSLVRILVGTVVAVVFVTVTVIVCVSMMEFTDSL